MECEEQAHNVKNQADTEKMLEGQKDGRLLFPCTGTECYRLMRSAHQSLSNVPLFEVSRLQRDNDRSIE